MIKKASAAQLPLEFGMAELTSSTEIPAPRVAPASVRSNIPDSMDHSRANKSEAPKIDMT